MGRVSHSPVPFLLVSVGFNQAGKDEVPWLATIQAGTGGKSSLPRSLGQTGAIHLHGLWSMILRRRKSCWFGDEGDHRESAGSLEAFMHRRCCILVSILKARMIRASQVWGRSWAISLSWIASDSPFKKVSKSASAFQPGDIATV